MVLELNNAIYTHALSIFLLCHLASCLIVIRQLPQLQVSHLCRPMAKGRQQGQLERAFSLFLLGEETSPSPLPCPVVFPLGLMARWVPHVPLNHSLGETIRIAESALEFLRIHPLRLGEGLPTNYSDEREFF